MGSERLSALRSVGAHPSVRRVLVVSGAFVSAEIGVWIAVTAIAFRFGGVDEASKVLFAQLLPATVMAVFVGRWIVRWGTTRVLVAGSAAQSFGLSIACVALAVGAPRALFYAGAVIASSFVVTTRPAISTGLPELVDSPEALVAANVAIGSVTAAATLVGPLVVALSISVRHGEVPFLVFALVTGGAALTSSRLPAHTVRGAVDDTPGPGLRTALGSGAPLIAVLVLASAALVVGCVDLLYVVIGVDVLGGTESTAGWLSTAAGVGALLGGVVAVVLIGRRLLWPWVLVAGVFTAGALALLGVSPNVVVAGVVFAAVQLGVTMLMIAARTLLQRLSDIDVLGHLAALAESAEMAMLLAGAVLLPLFVRISSARTAGAAVGAVLIVIVGTAAVVLARLESRFSVPIERLALLRNCELLELLPAPALETVARAAVEMSLDQGDTLFREGDFGDRYFVIASGTVRLSIGGRTVATRGIGEGFGELALLHETGRTATAVAEGPVELLAVDRSTFLFAVTGHADTLGRAHDVARERGYVDE